MDTLFKVDKDNMIIQIGNKIGIKNNIKQGKYLSQWANI